MVRILPKILCLVHLLMFTCSLFMLTCTCHSIVALLITIVNSKGSLSQGIKSLILGVHHHSIKHKIIEHQRIMDSSGEFHKIFLTQKQRSNVLLPTTKANIIAWWVSKTIISPNKKKVTRK